MMLDHYATLGVSPTAPAAVIRAAFLALMREYHPDRNPDPAAVERAKAVTAAFKVLGDFDQRNHYDWDRRRAREAAAAAAVKRPHRVRAGAIGAAAIGLAAIGAWVLPPAPAPDPSRVDPPVAKVRQAAVAEIEPATKARRVAAAPAKKPKTVKREAVAILEPPAGPVRVARIERVQPKAETTKRAPVVRSAAIKEPVPSITNRPAQMPPRRQVKAAAKAGPAIAKPTTDLASLDQFVMNFYGQSWRYGDASKRAALVQSRADFAARQETCVAEACKRAAYLKLMRDVSTIVETGQPESP